MTAVMTFGESLQERWDIALAHSGLSENQLARKLGVAKSRFTKLELTELVEAAEIMQVDARWLVRGIISPAAAAACASVDALARQPGNNRSTLNHVRKSLMTMPQPELAEAEMWTCRYCGCTPMAACAEGCEWVDSACSICSACLEPNEELDS
jgi:hypothetical protein